MISGQVPQSLSLLAKTGFLTTALKPVPAWEPIATMIDMTSKDQVLVDLGNAPMPTRQRGKFNAGDFVEKSLAITPIDWELPVGIEGNAIKDDQTGKLLAKVRSAGSNFQRHIAQTAFQALNDGDATTNFGAGYDGLAMFSNSHLDKGGAYNTLQDNVDNLTLTMDNFETIMVKAQTLRDDQGEFTDYNYDLLVVDPTNRRKAANITGSKEDPETTDRALNPYAGLKMAVSPKLDTGAWFLVASSETIKPIIIVMREQPHLEYAWIDPEAPKGGMYWFKFTARYNFYYGDWRTALMGHS